MTAPEFYLHGQDAWDAMLKAIEEARDTIDLEQYIFNDDDIGRKFVDVLRKKSVEGVQVRVLCDTVGSWNFYTSRLPWLMRKDGIEVRFVNIVSPWRINNFFSWFFRDHRKILIVDKEIGFTGGIGIRDDMAPWRDSNVKVHGGIVKEMSFAFNDMWVQAENTDLISRINKARRYSRGFNFITSAPYFHKRFLYYNIIDAIRSARHYVYITTPYFIPDPRLSRVLKLAVKRGVDVRIIVPAPNTVGISDRAIELLEPLVNRATRSHFDIFLRSGVKFFEYYKCFIHSKTIVIDDEWVTIGSFNLDNLSFLYNYEANIVSVNEDFINSIKRHFLADLHDCKEVTLEKWVKRPFIQKFREFLVLPIRRFL